jgi:hypothetical protein
MFPGAHSRIYRNEVGEVLGWDNDWYDEPDYCSDCGIMHLGDCPQDIWDDELDEDMEDY